jgi:threonine dehydrogenase-like Zn-dependent dehydrogenase
LLALEYTPGVARHAAARFSPRVGARALRLREVAPPRPPSADWLSVRPRLSGICGSDQALFSGDASPYLGTLTSTPFVPGHEVVGEIVGGPRRGERVVVEPALSCGVRGVEPPCPECAEGLYALCRNPTGGRLSAGLQIGYCRDTGGGWSEGLVAHSSQLHAVPSELSDEHAVLVEQLACALHAVRRAAPAAGHAVAVIGAGTIGLLTVAALRELVDDAVVVCAAKHPAQAHAARRLGADHTCPPDRLHVEGTRVTSARRLVGHLGRELLLGGFDHVLECVGSGAALEAAVSVTRPRGVVTMVGMPGQVRADLSLAWQRELELRGAYGYRGDFPAALELVARLGLGRLVGEGFALGDHRRALEAAPRAARAGAVKTVFELRSPA